MRMLPLEELNCRSSAKSPAGSARFATEPAVFPAGLEPLTDGAAGADAEVIEFAGALFVSPLFRPGSQMARKRMLATSSAPRNTATRAMDRRDIAILQRNPLFGVKREAGANKKRSTGPDLRHLAYRQSEISSRIMPGWSPKSTGRRNSRKVL